MTPFSTPSIFVDSETDIAAVRVRRDADDEARTLCHVLVNVRRDRHALRRD